MRIVAGKYRSRILKSPKTDAIRPTSDKVRGAVFNMLRARGVLAEAHAMDCFCGTGALGLEALSQGAETCVFVDNARESLALARENAAILKIGNEAQFILKDAAKMGARPESIPSRDLIFLDPPYRKNLVHQAIESLQNNNWLAENAFFVIEAEKGFAAPLPGLDIQDSRTYGDTLLMLAIALSR
jgi:16S rRNA (guanine966-N2)-methyltransferase